MDLDLPLYGNLEAARAAGVEPNTIRTWFQRGILTTGKHDLEAAVNGAGRTLTERRIYQIAIAGVLAGTLGPARAARVALAFSDIAEGPLPMNGNMERSPGELFQGAQTWLVAELGDDNARIVAVRSNSTIGTLLGAPRRPVVLLFLDPIIKAVHLALHDEQRDR